MKRIRVMLLISLTAFVVSGIALIYGLASAGDVRFFTLSNGLPAYGPKPIMIASIVTFVVAILIGTGAFIRYAALNSVVSRRIREHCCVECGYQLLENQANCPECGTEVARA